MEYSGVISSGSSNQGYLWSDGAYRTQPEPLRDEIIRKAKLWDAMKAELEDDISLAHLEYLAAEAGRDNRLDSQKLPWPKKILDRMLLLESLAK